MSDGISMINRRHFLLTSAGAAVALAGCVAPQHYPLVPPRRGGILNYGQDVQPVAGGIDPFRTVAFAGQNVITQLYEPLLQRTVDGELEPFLARSWTQSDDGREFTFVLRDDIAFSDGSPVTAEDVIFSFDQMVGGSSQAALMNGFTEAEILDDHTVRFRFGEPNGGFLNLASDQAIGVIVKQDWYEGASENERARGAVGTGPFVLSAWEDGVVIRLTRNPHYRDGLPHLDGINFWIFPDDQARIAALRQGTVEILWIGDQQLAEPLPGEGFHLASNATTRTATLFLDATTAPLDNLLFRRALSVGLDRAQAITLATYGYGEPTLIVPNGDPRSIPPGPDTPYHRYDPDLARELLAESGVSDPTVTLTFASDGSFARDQPLYEVMQEQYRRIGITLILRPVPWAEVLSSYATGEYQGIVSVPGIANPDPAAYFSAWLREGGSSNRLGEAGTEAAAILDEFITTTDPTRRIELQAELEHEVADKVLVLAPYVVTQRQEVWSSQFQGYEPDPYSFRRNLKNGWLA